MESAAIRSVYATVLDLSPPQEGAGPGALAGVRASWAEWVGSLLQRRAALYEQTTGTKQAIDFNPTTLGKQVPLDGVSLEQDWWETTVELEPAAVARFCLRDFQGDGRFWRTDIGFASRGTAAMATVQMGIESVEFRVQPLGWQVRAPGLWATIAPRFVCSVQGERVGFGDVVTHAAGSVGTLVHRLSDPNRRLPIVVVAVDNWSGASPLDHGLPQGLSRELFGLAHVHFLTDSKAAWELSDAIGGEHGCYNGGVRIYWPGFDSQRAPDFRTLLIPERIAAWATSAQHAVAKVRAALLRKIAPVSALRFATPRLMTELVNLRREHERSGEAARIRSELSISLDDTAMKLIDDALKNKDDELGRLKADHARELDELRQQMSEVHAHYSKQLTADASEEEIPDSEEDAGVTVEYYASNGGRRPVLDFADSEFPKDKESRDKFLESLTLFVPRWIEGVGKRFEKVTGASVSTRDGRKEDVWEYRAIKSQGEWVRVLFALVDGRRAVLLHALSKRQNRLDEGNIDTAKRRLKEYLG